MKSTAFLVNFARGGICNEVVLVRALQEKRIAGAALDVFQQEPLPPDHPLWYLPNVFISPHTFVLCLEVLSQPMLTVATRIETHFCTPSKPALAILYYVVF